MFVFAVVFFCAQAFFAENAQGQVINSLWGPNVGAGLANLGTGVTLANTAPLLNLNSPTYTNTWPATSIVPSRPVLSSPCSGAVLPAPAPPCAAAAWNPAVLPAAPVISAPTFLPPSLPQIACPLPVTPYLSVVGDNLLIDGTVLLTGSLPFTSSVNIGGNLQAGGNALVTSTCSCSNPCVQ